MKIYTFDSIDSTNSEAIRIAKTNPLYNCVILAKEQSGGRGRKEKSWHSPAGNLYMSLLLKHEIEVSRLPQFSFVAGLAVYDTIKSLVAAQNPTSSIKLKWPNDILISEKKISGILLESIENYLVIGIGINIINHPENINQLTTDLSAENIEIKTPEALLSILIANFEKNYRLWQHHSFLYIRQLWLKHAYRLNETITIHDGNKLVAGTFLDIDEEGRIIIQLSSGKKEAFSAGELSF